MESLDWTFIVGASFFERRRKRRNETSRRDGMEEEEMVDISNCAHVCFFAS